MRHLRLAWLSFALQEGGSTTLPTAGLTTQGSRHIDNMAGDTIHIRCDPYVRDTSDGKQHVIDLGLEVI